VAGRGLQLLASASGPGPKTAGTDPVLPAWRAHPWGRVRGRHRGARGRKSLVSLFRTIFSRPSFFVLICAICVICGCRSSSAILGLRFRRARSAPLLIHPHIHPPRHVKLVPDRNPPLFRV